MSYAMQKDDAKIEHASEAGENHDCHHNKETTKQSTHKESQTTDKCCDKGVCKCIGGACYSLSKYFGGVNVNVSVPSQENSRIIGSDESGDSAFLSRSKRPPRA